MPRRPLLPLLLLAALLPRLAAAVEPDPPDLREAYLALFSARTLGEDPGGLLVMGWSMHYRGAVPHSAFAYAQGRERRAAWRFVGNRATPEQAREEALAACERDLPTLPGATCRLLAVDLSVADAAALVLPPRGTAPPPFAWSAMHWRWGPAAARGVIVWGHGFGGVERDNRGAALPGFVSALNDAGWDVLRHDRAPADDALFSTLPRLVEGLPRLKALGYRRIVLGGQSRAGWQSLLAAAERPDLVDAVLAVAPAAHGEAGRANTLAHALGDFRRALAALPEDRVRLGVALFEGDTFDPDPEQRAALIDAAAATRAAPTLAILPNTGPTGHLGASDWRFTRDYTACLMTLVQAPPAGAPRGLRRDPCGGG